MNYLKKLALVAFAVMLLAGVFTVSSSAQRRVSIGINRGVSRPVVRQGYYIRRNPYFYRGFYGGSYWGDPFYDNYYWNDPYYTNPRLRALADRVYRENKVRKSNKKIREYRRKFGEDGYLSEKEQKKLNKAYREYNKNVQRLRDGE